MTRRPVLRFKVLYPLQTQVIAETKLPAKGPHRRSLCVSQYEMFESLKHTASFLAPSAC